MSSRRNAAASSSDSAFCRQQAGMAVVALKINDGQSYLVSVGPDFDPYYGFSADTIVEAYRTFLLVVALLKIKQLKDVVDVVSARLAFLRKPNLRLRAHLGSTYDQIRSMRIDDMPDIIKQEHQFRTSGGGRRR